MANKILIKSSQDAGDAAAELFVSAGNQKLHLAELALNTSDGILFAGMEPGADGTGDSPGTVIGAATDVYAQPLVIHSKAQALGTDSDVTFGDIRLDAINLGHASANTLTAASGVLSIESNALAQVASPTFTGTPAAPTASASTSTTQIATTAFVTTADNLKANLASPTLTGTPAAPTAASGTDTTQIATTAFVEARAATAALGLQVGVSCTAATANRDILLCVPDNGEVSVTCSAAAIQIGDEILTAGTGVPDGAYVATIVAGVEGVSVTEFTMNLAADDGDDSTTYTWTLAGIDTASSVWAFTAANGGTLTRDSSMIMTSQWDGITLSDNDVLLIKNFTNNPEQNGIYTVTAAPAANAAMVLTRHDDYDLAVEFPNAFTYVEGGTLYADTSWVCTNDGSLTLAGVASTAGDSVGFAQFNAPGNVTAGSDITKEGNTISVTDKFVRNDGSDSSSGTITAAGFTTTGTVSAEQLTTTDDCAIAGLVTVGETLAVTGTLSAATSSTIGNLTLANGSITDSGGAIDFGDENLSTSGTLGAGAATVTSLDAGSGSIITTGTVTADTIKLEGGSYDTTLDPGTPTASITYTLPPADGTENYVLKTNGSGALSWTENTGGIANDAAGTITLSDTATSAVSTAFTLKHLSSATNAVGGGVGMDFVQDCAASGAADNPEIGMQLECVLSENTAAEEDFDFSVKLMAAGLAAAEKFKVSSIGDITFDGQLDGGTF